MILTVLFSIKLSPLEDRMDSFQLGMDSTKNDFAFITAIQLPYQPLLLVPMAIRYFNTLLELWQDCLYDYNFCWSNNIVIQVYGNKIVFSTCWMVLWNADKLGVTLKKPIPKYSGICKWESHYEIPEKPHYKAISGYNL